jgi:general secretion pathway protein M
MTLPTGRRGRVLALALVLLAAALLWLAVADPVLALYDARSDEFRQRSALMQRMARIAAELPRLRQQAGQAAPAAGAATIDAGSDALAAAQLQDAVQGLASDTGASLSSVETLAAEPRGAYRRLALKLSLEASLPTLVDLMARIRQAEPAMLIDDLQIHTLSGSPQDEAGALSVGLTVYGYRRAESQ